MYEERRKKTESPLKSRSRLSFLRETRYTDAREMLHTEKRNKFAE